MKRLFLSAGHSTATDPGAINSDGVKEAILTAELRRNIARELITLGLVPEVDSDNNNSGQTVKVIVEHIKNIDVAIDLHFNSYSHPSATGTEALVPFKYSDFEVKLASDLTLAVAKTLQITNRGAKTEANSARGRLIFMRPNCENILLEVCFISNPNDMAAYEANKDTLAKTLAMTIYNSLK